ncbi:hypothetical protein BN873_770044 [Candidatus Competibacter denitrificans Run_A_D11]|uniref:Uncharacterized protein n=1 Tax=Candidatus Competibacter denitrificans Run_A_D11 TaxID=1400863 RepID=W6M7Q9_9GAMM|nr:hypothetical protein [Candidatus Competibacter denitrificans]CDI04011.1 hypothetical protein BN873_770044 [Candidatus Competibacter denitrificans Run_A_D11]HAS86439.1 hypothetical protein [Candidatus Competibacteraceae bacterium]HRC70274.1 hypothetical protein [Candidatus Competibacter denitrificans]
MDEEHTQFKIYADEAKIPGHQRAWVWGAVAMAILLSGLAVGWLLSGGVGASSQLGTGANTSAVSAAEAAAWLAQQETVNQQIQERISRLEQVLAESDPCGPVALEALRPSADNL